MITTKPFIINMTDLGSTHPNFPQNEQDVSLKLRVAEKCLQTLDRIAVEQVNRLFDMIGRFHCFTYPFWATREDLCMTVKFFGGMKGKRDISNLLRVKNIAWEL